MSAGAGEANAFGGAPCHRDMPLSKQPALAEEMGLRDGKEKGPVIAVDGPAASARGPSARAVARRVGVPHMDAGRLYRAVAPSLWRWGGAPASESEALRAADDLGFAPDDPELRSEPVSKLASMISAYSSVRAALL